MKRSVFLSSQVLQCHRSHVRHFLREYSNGRAISYFHGFPSEPLLSHTIPDVIRAAAAQVPDRTCVISCHQQLQKTFSDLNRDANRLAHGLQRLGVKKGDRVGIWSPNCYEWIVTQFGTAKLGAIMVNVNPGYREKEFLYCANLVHLNTLVFSQKFKSSDYCDILQNISPNIWTKESVNVSCSEMPDLRNLICLPPLDDKSEETAHVNVPRFHDILKSSPDDEFIDETITFDDAINIQFTSGTTGNPKGATLSHHSTINNAYFSGKRQLAGLVGDGKFAKICVPNPLYHCFGSVNGSLTAAVFRSTIVLPAATAQPGETLRAIHETRSNILYGTPTMFVDILAQSTKGLDLSSVERAVMSGAPCPKETIVKVKKEVLTKCNLIYIPYGTTETSPVITTPTHDVPEKYAYDTVGRAMEHVEVKIADPSTGSVVPLAQSGEVMTRGFHTFIGYWNQPDKTAEVLDDRHWYHTGDIGVMNDEGYVSIIGRIKDMIIRGGENVYPREIEDFLLTHESIQDVNVIGIPDQRLGEEICAFVILKQQLTNDQEEEMKHQLISYCKGRIAHFKIPKYFLFVTDFPRTVTMKVQKHKLKDIAAQMLPHTSNK